MRAPRSPALLLGLLSLVTGSLLSSVKLSSLLRGTSIADAPLARVFRASEHGWSSQAFHSRCDFTPPLPTLVLLKTSTGRVCGAFNPLGWQSRDDYRDSLKAFLFVVTSAQGDVEKSVKVGGSSAAVYDFGDRALWFAEGLFVPLNAKYQPLRLAKSGLGTSYSRLKAQGSLFNERGEQGSAELVEMECWSSAALIAQSANMAAAEQERLGSANAVLRGFKRLETFLFGAD